MISGRLSGGLGGSFTDLRGFNFRELLSRFNCIKSDPSQGPVGGYCCLDCTRRPGAAGRGRKSSLAFFASANAADYTISAVAARARLHSHAAEVLAGIIDNPNLLTEVGLTACYAPGYAIRQEAPDDACTDRGPCHGLRLFAFL